MLGSIRLEWVHFESEIKNIYKGLGTRIRTELSDLHTLKSQDVKFELRFKYQLTSGSAETEV